MKATHAALVAGLDTDSNGIVSLLVDDDIVTTSQGESLVEVASQVFLVAEEDRSISRVNVEQLKGS